MRIGVLLTGDASSFTNNRYGNYGDLFIQLLQRPGDVWHVFDVRCNEYPQEPSSYDGFIVTGSASTAHETEPWILELERFIQQLHQNKIKTLGVCFGHQAVANALGGRSARNPTGWEVGTHRLNLAESFWNKPYASGFPNNPKILESHQDHVVVLPPGGELLASSPNTPVQMYAVGESILCIQGHPEFHPDVVDDLVSSRMDEGTIAAEVGLAGRRSLELGHDQTAWKNLILRFFSQSD